MNLITCQICNLKVERNDILRNLCDPCLQMICQHNQTSITAFGVLHCNLCDRKDYLPATWQCLNIHFAIPSS